MSGARKAPALVAEGRQLDPLRLGGIPDVLIFADPYGALTAGQGQRDLKVLSFLVRAGLRSDVGARPNNHRARSRKLLLRSRRS